MMDIKIAIKMEAKFSKHVNLIHCHTVDIIQYRSNIFIQLSMRLANSVKDFHIILYIHVSGSQVALF